MIRASLDKHVNMGHFPSSMDIGLLELSDGMIGSTSPMPCEKKSLILIMIFGINQPLVYVFVAV
jgi:hypothetical protein